MTEVLALARQALKRERLGTALDLYYDAVTQNPERAEYRAEMVTAALLPMGMPNHALVESIRAVHIDENCPKAWRAMAMAESALGNTDRAVAAFDRQLELAPNDPCALLDRSSLALDVGDWKLATTLSRKVLESDNVFGGDALHFLALAAYRQGKHEEAIELDNWAIEAGCFFPEIAKWNQSLALLALGRFKEGWERHLARKNSKGDPFSVEQFRRFKKPLFEFQEAPAKIHVTQEMGFGDGLIMLRYLPLLVEKGYQVQLEVDSALEELVKGSLPNVNVMRKAPDFPGTLGIPDFDYLLPLLNCPLVFGTEVETIPWNGPYIKADPKLIEKYRFNSRGKKIGVCWSSGLFTQGCNARWHAEFNKRKSVGIENLRPLFDNNRDSLFVSLQIGSTRKDGDGYVLDVLPQGHPDWSHTAAVIENLDLVITVDTGVAHLAGAMGKPFWLMMHTEGVWQWFADRPNSPWNEKSPWYPTAKIFRAKKPHEWDNVVSRIVRELANQEI